MYIFSLAILVAFFSNVMSVVAHAAESAPPPSAGTSQIQGYLDKNKQWARAFNESNPGLFAQLAKGQSPPILWIGCSDSRVPETTILNVLPGQVFTTRNIANIIHPTDVSLQSVVQYSVVNLKVKHVFVVGHVGCGGVAAALSSESLGPFIDAWISPVKLLKLKFKKQLDQLQGEDKNRFLEIENVKAGVDSVRQNAAVIEAVAQRGLTVHGLIYDIRTGILNEVKIPANARVEE